MSGEGPKNLRQVSLQPSATGPRGRGPTGLPTWCQYVGRRVQKVFHDPATGVARPFDGWVDSVKVEGKMPLFHIKYEDGDDEIVQLKEFRRVVVDPDAATPAPSAAAAASPVPAQVSPQRGSQGQKRRGRQQPQQQHATAGAGSGEQGGGKRAKRDAVPGPYQQAGQAGGPSAPSSPFAREMQLGSCPAAAEQLLDPLSRLPSATAGTSLEPRQGAGAGAGQECVPAIGAAAAGERGGPADGGSIAALAEAAAALIAAELEAKNSSKAVAGGRGGWGSGSKPPRGGGAAAVNAGAAGSAAVGKAAVSRKAAAKQEQEKQRKPKAAGKAANASSSAAANGPAAKPAAERGRPPMPAGIPAAKRAAGAPKALKRAKRDAEDNGEAEAGPNLPPLKERQRREYAPGTEPWRTLPGFKLPVRLEQDLSHDAKKALAACREAYYRRYRKAEVEEDDRVATELVRREHKKEGAEGSKGGGRGKGKAGAKGKEGGAEKSLSRRPDRVTESWMKSQGRAINQEKMVGFVPGIAVNDGFYSRSELSVCGMHGPPVAGIYYSGMDKAGKGVPSFALSVVASGCYEDDGDHGEEIIYTGEGGNDLLGTRKQVAEQELVRGNLALVGNIMLGLPVRVVRKNPDPAAPYGCVLVFDGLYNVVEYWSEKGNSGKTIYRYRLMRRPGQGPLLSQKVSWGGISAPKEVTALNRPGIVDTDITGGLERIPIWAVNATEDGEVPPCTRLDRVPDPAHLIHAHLGLSEARLVELRASGWQPSVEYVGGYVLAEGVPQPPAPQLPAEYEGRPHDFLKLLNHGSLPYHQSSKPGRPPYLIGAKPVVYECGPWCKCPLGKDCPQAASQRGLRYRLEVFRKDDGTGWAVRNLDMIPQWSFICMYYGEVFPAEAYEALMEQGYDGSYCTDMLPRPGVDWNGDFLPEAQRTSQHAQHVVCGLRKRNVGALLNHSCDPNVFVQPILSDHHDLAMPGIGMFASKDIMPFTELTWDYGEHYVLHQLDGACKCGSEECIAKKAPAQGGQAQEVPAQKGQ